MANNTNKSNTFKSSGRVKGKSETKKSFLKDRKFHLAFGFFLLITAIFLFIAFLSYLFTGKADQSVVEAVGQDGLKVLGLEARNWLGLMGALSAHFFIFKWFGLATFFIPPLLFLTGFKIVFKKTLVPLTRAFVFSVFFMFWLSLLLGYFSLDTMDWTSWSFLSGGVGFELSVLFHSILGKGTFLFLVFALLVFLIYFFNITSLFSFSSKSGPANASMTDPTLANTPKTPPTDEQEMVDGQKELESWTVKNIEKPEELEVSDKLKLDVTPSSSEVDPSPVNEPEFSINEEVIEEKVGDKIENYDPTLDLGSYKYPTLDLLNQHTASKAQVTKDELEQNKDKIIETLINFKIGISSIKATIGPTVTLYEIVPDAGIKISKIKNLEDDIALNLSALGIRIIAPIPGKGTIGIEVPNKNREMVTIRSVLSADKFMTSDKELPVVLGKTISNEVFVTDLAKMPHLLMAGATGQGKSVGLNVILASLIYKKHPSQLKFVLVDPKKVELTIFNKIERHFLAKIPNSEEAIITDTKSVVNTLNSLCIEMEKRYGLMKDAGCRNLKEYNAKFVNRQLNPEKGHRFLPYIVLVIDELADLMMTAGKEVEGPIARLAQLARAIGIHLVVATQRPSVNVITGLIKANFPARMSFKVTQRVDSRTILDTGGADQLVGMGDMLLSMDSDIVRLQCPYIDSPEIENICEFIGSQRGYESAYMLPEYVGDDSGDGPADVDLSDRDVLFEDAARLIVLHQQGSTSLIQRKMKLGYNRAGRLIDQLEASGIVGPFEGSKAREVLIPDDYSLEQLLNRLNEEQES